MGPWLGEDATLGVKVDLYWILKSGWKRVYKLEYNMKGYSCNERFVRLISKGLCPKLVWETEKEHLIYK